MKRCAALWKVLNVDIMIHRPLPLRPHCPWHRLRSTRANIIATIIKVRPVISSAAVPPPRQQQWRPILMVATASHPTPIISPTCSPARIDGRRRVQLRRRRPRRPPPPLRPCCCRPVTSLQLRQISPRWWPAARHQLRSHSMTMKMTTMAAAAVAAAAPRQCRCSVRAAKWVIHFRSPQQLIPTAHLIPPKCC